MVDPLFHQYEPTLVQLKDSMRRLELQRKMAQSTLDGIELKIKAEIVELTKFVEDQCFRAARYIADVGNELRIQRLQNQHGPQQQPVSITRLIEMSYVFLVDDPHMAILYMEVVKSKDPDFNQHEATLVRLCANMRKFQLKREMARATLNDVESEIRAKRVEFDKFSEDLCARAERCFSDAAKGYEARCRQNQPGTSNNN